jgi:hypothetical protein
MTSKKGPGPGKAPDDQGPAGDASRSSVWSTGPAGSLSWVAEGVATAWNSPAFSARFAAAGPPVAKPPASAAIKAFRQLAMLWGLGMSGQLTLLGLRETQKATYYRWLREAEAGSRALQLDRDQMARVGHLLAIFEAVGHLFQVPEQADAWVHRPNAHPVFQGRSPLERLLRGGMEDFIAVRAYAEAAREGLA